MSRRSRSRSNSPSSLSFSNSRSRSRSRSVSPQNTIASAIKIPIKQSNEEHSDKIIEGISPINKENTTDEDKKQKLKEEPITKKTEEEQIVTKPKTEPVYFTRTFNYSNAPSPVHKNRNYYDNYNYYNQDLRYSPLNGTENEP